MFAKDIRLVFALRGCTQSLVRHVVAQFLGHDQPGAVGPDVGFFNNKEGFPRGQGSAMLMAAEIAGLATGRLPSRRRISTNTPRPLFEGIAFPSLGVLQAWNDRSTGILHVVTYAAAPDKRGAATRWRVTNLPGVTILTVRLNGQRFTRFAAVRPRTIEIRSTIDAHQFEIVTGYRGDGTRAAVDPPVKPRTAAVASLLAQTLSDQPAPKPFAVGPGCPCCGASRD